ncbi:unnamed protein product [Trifolium pratense]|uniref:Uncharacterized protein n=1 Tax=Trifolium pratense TaxID=57577 RepID=A0ACB0M7T8_TRIPR|nr:unnamed protein product [Trifolium pratense]
MASVSATSLTFQPSFIVSTRNNQVSYRTSSFSAISVGSSRKSFPSLRLSRFRICAATPETVQKVSNIVRKQLALTPETELTPATKFSALGADSLDTVEIVMGLEEEFGLNIEDDSAEDITTIQEAADLIEKLVQKKDEA